jgi:hypothetical protein
MVLKEFSISQFKLLRQVRTQPGKIMDEVEWVLGFAGGEFVGRGGLFALNIDLGKKNQVFNNNLTFLD